MLFRGLASHSFAPPGAWRTAPAASTVCWQPLLGDLVTVVVADSIHCGVAGFGISGNMSGMVLPDVTKAASRA